MQTHITTVSATYLSAIIPQHEEQKIGKSTVRHTSNAKDNMLVNPLFWLLALKDSAVLAQKLY